MTGIFRANNPLNASMLFVYGLLLKLSWFLKSPAYIPEGHGGFLYDEIIMRLKPAFISWPVLPSIIAFVLLYSQAVSINVFVNSRRLLPSPNYLPAMGYLLITSLIPEWNMLSAPLLINSILIWIWARMSNLNNVSSVKGTLFNIGFATALCSFIYLPSLVVILIIFIALLVTRAPRIAEFVMYILGIVTLWYFLFAWLFYTNKLYSFDLAEVNLYRITIPKNPLQYVAGGILVLMGILGAFFVQSQSAKQVIQVRKRWLVLMIFLVILAILPFTSDASQYWLCVLFPLSILTGAVFFYTGNKWVRLVFHWGSVAFILYSQYFTGR